MSAEAERTLVLTLEVDTYGSQVQAVATAQRIAAMLEVELHKRVKLASLETKRREGVKNDTLPDG